jgi:cytochrome c oxidase cbb3-type subunit III
MIRLAILLAAGLLVTTACGTRDFAPGRPPANSQSIPPSEILDFNFLYARNCAGCHGTDGKGGAAIALGDPVYLAIADDATIRRISADGVPGTAMPAFAQHFGGMLTDGQIEVIVSGIRARWAKPDALRGAAPPPYAAQSPGDPKRGATVFGVYCASCHGVAGRGSKRASSVVDGSYLALVSDQGLRTTVIAGLR